MMKNGFKAWEVIKRNVFLLFAYIAFNLLSGMLFSVSGDSGGPLVSLLLSTAMLGFFALWGYILLYPPIGRSVVPHLLSVLSVPAIGVTIWCVHFFNLQGVRYTFDLFAWTLYFLYTIWCFPIYENLRQTYFERNPEALAQLSLLTVFLPSVGALLGAALRTFGGRARVFMSKRKKTVATASLAGILLTVLALQPPGLLSPSPLFTKESYPRVDGSTAAIPMAQGFARELTGMSVIAAKSFVHFNTTHQAYVNLVEKRADIIFTAEPSKEELALAAQHGIELVLTPIGRDAFVFITHKDNPVGQLSLEQIRSIYSGKITNWKEVGGTDKPITAYQREANSGSQTLMENKVMKGLPMAPAPKERVMEGMAGIIDAVAEYKNSESSLGYSIFYYASEMYRKGSIKFIAIDGVECSKETIRSGAYPLSGNLYAVTRKGEPKDSAAMKMLDWIQNKDGQKAVEKGGFVPISE